MNLDFIANRFKDWLDQILHVNWLSNLILVLAIVIVTAIISHLFTSFLNKMLRSKRGPVPSASIFINIGRVGVWGIGISVILSSCFNIDIGAAITALGVGGIAVSLGFQDTLSNLISGLQIIAAGLVEPGDRIQVGGHTGVVNDITWRHTTITTVRGEKVTIPNSLINTQALIKLPPETDVHTEILINGPSKKPLDQLTAQMEKEIAVAVAKVAVIDKEPKIKILGTTEHGYRALLTFSIAPGPRQGDVVDIALKAVSGVAHKRTHSKKKHHKESLKEKIHDRGAELEAEVKDGKPGEAGAAGESAGAGGAGRPAAIEPARASATAEKPAEPSSVAVKPAEPSANDSAHKQHDDSGSKEHDGTDTAK